MSKLILIGGLAGSGKSSLGKLLARRLGYAYLDKDTLTRELVDALVVEAGSEVGPGDRDTDIYRDRVRPHEYACFMNTIAENVELGVSTIATAPFISEMNDADWIEDMTEMAEDHGASVHFIWMNCDIPITKNRITSRNARRDQIKLSIWRAYEAFAGDVSLPVHPVRVFDNSPEQSLIRISEKVLHDLVAP